VFGGGDGGDDPDDEDPEESFGHGNSSTHWPPEKTYSPPTLVPSGQSRAMSGTARFAHSGLGVGDPELDPEFDPELEALCDPLDDPAPPAPPDPLPSGPGSTRPIQAAADPPTRRTERKRNVAPRCSRMVEG
jgi:hypothetical protein